ncbi:ABC transporter ATP-binding protein [Ottowia thiooxydans]|uniref:ABC-type multidrug transport system fused ATPase/permease subunit n=1 Tax=Ottowia thiooxydans TaxID=219182 RepID=A0ABV2QDP3_9BURK
MLVTCKKIWELLTPAEQRKAIWILLLISAMALLQTAGVLSIAPFLAVLARPGIIQENAWLSSVYARYGFSDSVTFIFALGLITMVAVVASSIFKAITLHVVSRFIQMQRQSLGTRLLSQYLRQPYEFFLTRNPSELAKNVLSDVDQLVFDLLQPLSIVVAQGAVALAMTLLVLAYDPQMALWIVAAVGTLYGVIYFSVRKRLAFIGAARQAANIRRYQSCHEVISGIKDVKLTQAKEMYLRDFSEASRETSRRSAAADTLSQAPLYLVEAAGYTGLIAIALVLLWRSGDVSHVLPTIGLYGFAAYRLLPALQSMYSGLTKLKFSGAVLEPIHRDLSMPGEDQRVSHNVIVPQHEIRLEGVSYAYPSAKDKPVLKNRTLVIPARKITGISGQSGVGKSTVMDIVLGLLHPHTGALLVDGKSVTPQDVGAWQRSIGYVPQHIYLADTSVAENIAFGVAKDLIDMKAVESAARAAHIHDFIVGELSAGYQSLVGDRGIRLSGGQRQRLGIARALYRDPPVLCMDEATSALDGPTEEAVNGAIRSLSGSKTVVIIAHRQSTLDACDHVLEIIG